MQQITQTIEDLDQDVTYQELVPLAESGSFDVIPVARELYSDEFTPIQVMRKLQQVSNHCYLLESVENTQKWSRYTFLGYDPTLEITCTAGTLTITDTERHVYENANPTTAIRQIMAKYRSPKQDDLPRKNLPPFTGGLVGYFSYDYLTYSEPTLNLDAFDEEGFKDVDLMLFDKVIAFDNFRQKIVLIANARCEDFANNYLRAQQELDAMRKLLVEGSEKKILPGHLRNPLTPLFNKDEYCAMVERAKKYIYEGDIFQVVLSNRFAADYEGSLFDTYRILRTTNPSPYMFYFSSDDIELAGASPETLVKLENGVLHTYPLAGTRPRGATEEEDKKIKDELLSDEKELAEHNMLVDLGRNDLGKVAVFGSVQVEHYLNVEYFSHVMHIGSTVRGVLRQDKDALDTIASVLPAGTLSGAPKLRACQIINELENNKRGVYGGAIGYLDFTGNMDTCIAIRLVFKKNGRVFVRSGAGIVADSVPENEFQECINKAKAVFQALELAEGGLN